MKTKIIYISGGDIFDMVDIRAALDDVRSTLGLGKDTILFGVPIDNDSIDLSVQSKKSPDTAPLQLSPDNAQTVQIIDPPEIIPVKINTIKSAVKKNIQKNKVKSVTIQTPDQIGTAPDTDIEPDHKIIPILSILGAGYANDAETNNNFINTDDTVEQDDTLAVDVPSAPAYVTSTEVKIEQVKVTQDTKIISNTITAHNVVIEDFINDDLPDDILEQTLEQLLEKMTPLREDHTPDPAPIKPTPQLNNTKSDTDITLEQLAAEFIEKQDEIPTASAIETSGKIGKLKNILPFKKTKREDTSLMGDLFGWAGIAANDDEFSIPGFFTNTVSKK